MNVVKSGYTYIDLLFGGGLFSRKVVEVFGGESTGKSALFQSLMIKYASQVDEIHYFDIEEAFDPTKYELMGGDPTKINLYGSMSLDDFMSAVYDILKKREGKKILIVWDTLAATIPKDDRGIQRRPQMIREFLARLRGFQSDYYLVILNQAYDQIGTGGITSPGGRGLRHFTDLRIKLNRVSTVKTPDKKVLGIEGQMTVVKSRISYEGLSVPYYLDVVRGLDYPRSLLLFLNHADKLQKKAGGVKILKFGDREYKWQTVDQFAELLNSDEEFRKILDFYVYEYFVNFSSILKVKYADGYNELARYFSLPELELTEEELRAYNTWKMLNGGNGDGKDSGD